MILNFAIVLTGVSVMIWKLFVTAALGVFELLVGVPDSVFALFMPLMYVFNLFMWSAIGFVLLFLNVFLGVTEPTIANAPHPSQYVGTVSWYFTPPRQDNITTYQHYPPFFC